jgi:hypothetical protein
MCVAGLEGSLTRSGLADRAQILQLMLRRLNTLTQYGTILFAHRRIIAEPRVKRVLAVLQVGSSYDAFRSYTCYRHVI